MSKDKLVTCPRCGSDACYETKEAYNLVNRVCYGCGFMTHNYMKEDSEFLQEQLDRIGDNGGIDHKLTDQEVLRKWLKDTVGLEQYFEALVENGFDDLESVTMITMNELDTLGIIEKMGHKMKLLRYITKLNENEIGANQEGDTTLI